MLLGGPESSTASPLRARAIDEIADAIVRVDRPHPTRVAVDGVGAAGKTVLADELGRAIELAGRPVIRAGVDGFHNPREVRYRRGPTSPEGYYLDSFDYEAIVAALLRPLGPGGSGRYRTAVYDFRTETVVNAPELVADPSSVLVFDGVFVLRRELRRHWDFSVFVQVCFDVTTSRALTRDLKLFGSREAVMARYDQRYVPGETLYLTEERPHDRADVVVVNDDPGNPQVRWKARR